MAEILLVREDLRRALLTQPMLLTNVAGEIGSKSDAALTAFSNTEKSVMAAAAFVRRTQVEIADAHKAMLDCVRASCMEAAGAAASEAAQSAVQSAVQREWHRKSLIAGFGAGFCAALAAVALGLLSSLV